MFSEESRDFLDDIFKEEELVSAIRSFPSGKSPGLDGMAIEWYHHYSEALDCYSYTYTAFRSGVFPPPFMKPI